MNIHLNSNKDADFESYVQAEITADWLPEEVKFAAYVNGQRWNGWVMPFFSEQAAHSLLPYMPELSYDSDCDTFVSKANAAGDEDDIFRAVDILVDGVPIKTYAIGAGSWCWELCG